MQYLGGKTLHARHLVAIMQSWYPGRRLVDAFCGGLSVTAHASGPRLANDACVPLIAMYRAWAQGWRPPEVVTEDDYRAVRERMDMGDPLTAFVGFGCSFGGKWWGGYARGKRRNGTPTNYAKQAANSLACKMGRCADVEFACMDYRELPITTGDLVYCDPPYRGTTGYTATGLFDHDEFDAWCRHLAVHGVPVFVSEYTPPPGAIEIWRKAQRGHGLSDRDECLFLVTS